MKVVFFHDIHQEDEGKKAKKALSTYVSVHLWQNGTKLFFRGQVIWEAVMDELLSIGLSNAKKVFFFSLSHSIFSFFNSQLDKTFCSVLSPTP